MIQIYCDKICRGIQSGIQLKSNYRNYHVHKIFNQNIYGGSIKRTKTVLLSTQTYML